MAADHRGTGQAAARPDRRRHDGLQGGADRDRRRPRGGHRLAAQEGPGGRRQEGRPGRRPRACRRPARRRRGAWSRSTPRPTSSPATRTSRSSCGAIAELALDAGGDLERLLQANVPASGRTVADEITQTIAVIGENIDLRRTAAVEVDQGVVGCYVHAALAPGLGKIGVLVGLHSAGDPEQLAALGRQLAMHVAAARPAGGQRRPARPGAGRSASARSTPTRRAPAASPTTSSTRSSTGRMRKYLRGGRAARAAVRDRPRSQGQGRDRAAGEDARQPGRGHRLRPLRAGRGPGDEAAPTWPTRSRSWPALRPARTLRQRRRIVATPLTMT